MAQWYTINNVQNLDSPALVVFPDRVKNNIDTAIGLVSLVDKLRPHVKTNKSADACKMMLRAGITKFKCATIAEAEMLGTIKAPDVLLAYQPLGPKLRRFVHLIKKFPGTRYSCLTDNFDSAREQADTFKQYGLTVPVYVDLNVGMNRTGIVPGTDAVELCKYCHAVDNITLAGLHAYDGHLRSEDILLRTKECNDAFGPVELLKEKLVRLGIPVLSIIAGGSPSFPIHANRKNVECSPGTFIYWDKGYLDKCKEQNFIAAALLVTRVVSLPAPNKVCTDLGHKSVAAENEMARRVHFLNSTDLTPISQSEEHLVCEVKAGHNYKIGDVLYALPYHICPTVALYERAITVENGNISGEWENIARDRKITV